MSPSRKKRRPPLDATLARLERRHRVLLSKLSDLGFVLRGSIAKRWTRCGQPTCRCKASPPELHGPYSIWTRKVAGKTVTVQLPPEQAVWCRDWSRNMRRLDRVVRALQAIGLDAASALRAP
ncbi:MAG TPA: DUF6788 family protein [Candidatus Thermoplasmatota archaeon]